MDEEVKEAELKVQSEAWLPAKEVEKGKTVETRMTREKAREARREAKLATKAIKKANKAEAKAIREKAREAKREAKLATKAIKKANEVEAKMTKRDEILTGHEKNRRATVNQRAKQAEVGLTTDLELPTIKQVEKEVIEAEDKDNSRTEETREVKIDTEVATKVQEDIEVNAQLQEGTIKILLMPPVSALQIINLGKMLRMTQNLRIISTCGSVDKPSTIVVLADQPIPLVDVLSQIPIVDQIIKKGNEIRILLKAETHTSVSM